MVRHSGFHASAKRVFGKDADCFNKKFTLVIPQYSDAVADRGCPGSLQPCHADVLTDREQKMVCTKGTKDMVVAMQKAFGTGNTVIRARGTWVNPQTHVVTRERNITVETRYGACLTPSAQDDLLSRLDHGMKKLCQKQWLAVTEEGGMMFNTGGRKR